jgi:signal transduction histidine kinase
MPSAITQRRMLWGLILGGAWTVAGLFFSTQAYLGAAYSGRALSWGKALAVSLLAWYLRAALSPLVLTLARRLPLRRGAWRRAALIHVVASVVLGVLQFALFAALVHRLGWVSRRAVSPVELHTNIVVYWLLVAVSHAAQYYRHYRERELTTSRLETQLAQTRLELLGRQLQPHFLFNALNAASELMHEDPERADLMLTQIADLLRTTLAEGVPQEVALEREMNLLRLYLTIQQTRFLDRLRVKWAVESETLTALVPPFILQPLAENAIRHGIAPRSVPGTVTVRAARKAHQLELQVSDDGGGLRPEGATPREGLGLSNTRARLREMYGDRQELVLAERTGGGLEVTLRLPLRMKP